MASRPRSCLLPFGYPAHQQQREFGSEWPRGVSPRLVDVRLLTCGVTLEKRAVLRDMWATYVKTPLPTAVLDKSVFQRIAELPSKHRKATWDELHSRFQVVIPFVLVEEILVNRGNPEPIPPRVAETMFR